MNTTTHSNSIPCIIARETFGCYRLDVFETRFGGLEFFVLDANGEAIRQTSDIVEATTGFENVPGVGDAIARACEAASRRGDGYNMGSARWFMVRVLNTLAATGDAVSEAALMRDAESIGLDADGAGLVLESLFDSGRIDYVEPLVHRGQIVDMIVAK